MAAVKPAVNEFLILACITTSKVLVKSTSKPTV